MKLINDIAKWTGALFLAGTIVAAPYLGRVAYAWDSRDFHKDRVGADIVRDLFKKSAKDMFGEKEDCISPEAYNALREEAIQKIEDTNSLYQQANERAQKNANFYIEEKKRAEGLQKELSNLEKELAENRVIFRKQWIDNNDDGLRQEDEIIPTNGTVIYHPNKHSGKTEFQTIFYSNTDQTVSYKIYYPDGEVVDFGEYEVIKGENIFRGFANGNDFKKPKNNSKAVIFPTNGDKPWILDETFSMK